MTRKQLDSSGRPLEVIAPDGGLTTDVRNAQGWVTQETDPLGRITTFPLDSSGYPTTITFADGNARQYVSQAAFHALTQYTDENGNIWSYTYDSGGHQLTVKDPLSEVSFGLPGATQTCCRREASLEGQPPAHRNAPHHAVSSCFRPTFSAGRIAAMHLLAYWRWDNYRRDLDEGAGFNFNSKQPRLHSAIDAGETLWLFTALKAPPRYFLTARLVVRSKTLNAPGYRDGKYRVWGDLARSRYFRVRPDVPQDEAFELLRGLPLVSGSLAKATRATLPQGCQTIRGVTPQGHRLLDTFAKALVTEERASAVIDEYTLERGLAADEEWLAELLRREHTGASVERVERLLAGVRRDRRLVRELHELYGGKCQVCAFDSPAVYGVPSAEGCRGGGQLIPSLAGAGCTRRC